MFLDTRRFQRTPGTCLTSTATSAGVTAKDIILAIGGSPSGASVVTSTGAPHRAGR